MDLDLQAQALNDILDQHSPALTAMLSKRGKAIYFPKLGILSQSADAQGKAINATIGIALEESGKPMCLPSLEKQLTLSTDKAFPYAPSPGRPDIRKLWSQMLIQKNPELEGKAISQPLVTAALTHGLSMAGYLFCDEGDEIILPDLYWENYDLVFGLAYGTRLRTFPTFTQAGGFNVAGLVESLTKPSPSGKKIVCLNFPNNPTGYTPLIEEVNAIIAALRDAAVRGDKLVVLIDDAYFGLVFEDGVYTQSIFTNLCDAHENLLAVKIDGPTKEDYVWGFRVGFLTYGIKGGSAAVYGALEAKTAGAVRGNISNTSNPAQSLLVQSWSSEAYTREKQQKFDVLESRYRAIRSILEAHPEYAEQFLPLPFNSGYFMCIKPLRVDAEALRQKLLTDYSTGVIAFSGLLRLAFSSTEKEKLPKLFANIFAAAKEFPNQ